MAFQNKVDYEPIGNNRFLEKNRLIEANSVNVIETAEFPGLPNDCVKEKFRCSTKFALSLKNQLLAIVTPSRELELYALKDDLIIPKCRVRVLHDPHPEYCLLEWSASQNLLLSTRSTAVLDVFDCNGVYCYSISLGDNTFDASKIISHITTTSSTDPDTYDLAYVLQLHSRFSVFRLGKGNAFDQIFNYNLNIPRTYCLLYIPSNHLLAVSTEYLVDKPVTDATNPMEIGLALFEYRHQQLTKKVLPVPKTGWIWLPFLQKQRAVVVSLEADLERQSVLAVTSRGDILLFDFFFHLQRFIKGELIPEVKLMQGILINGESVAALYRHGLIVQEK
uniref:Uncharacterized protein n=1 Tax=Panagrolaimus sp. JU765 TaxID=591449 RepID=A0AC34R2Q0_9BILA